MRVFPVPVMFESMSWSDDWSFWEQEIRAFSFCDTSYLRNHHYHELTDTLDFGPMADVTWGATFVVQALANGEIDTD